MSVTFHADDYGITEQQAADILKLSQVCGGQGALSSVSISTWSRAVHARRLRKFPCWSTSAARSPTISSAF